MSVIIKVFLLLAVVACISKAQLNEARQKCVCQRVSNYIFSKSNIKGVKIYQANTFCNRVEIVVTNRNGYRYCLNPVNVEKIVSGMISKSTTSKPTGVSFTTGRNTSI